MFNDEYDDDDDDFNDISDDSDSMEFSISDDEMSIVTTDTSPIENTITVSNLTPKELQKLNKYKRDFYKKYFSSLHARRSSVTYFGIGDDTQSIICSNTTGQYFATNMASELGVHVIKFKKESDWELIEQLKKEIMILDPGKIYLAQVPMYLSQINKYKKDNVKVWKDGNITVCTEKDDTTYDKNRQIISYPVSNHHLITTVSSMYKYVCGIDVAHTETHSHQWIELNKNPNLANALSYVKLELSKFKRSDGTPIFQDYYPVLQPILFDGVGTPSVKEFIKKHPTGSYRLYAWVEEDRYVRTMTVYEDDHVIVKSMKPNMCWFPVPQMKITNIQGE